LTASFITFHNTLSKTMLAVSMLMPSAKRKWSCMQERIKIAQQSKKQVKFENITSRLTQNIFATPSQKVPWLAYNLSTQWVQDCAAIPRSAILTIPGYNRRQNVPSSWLTQVRCLMPSQLTSSQLSPTGLIAIRFW
jgi:formate dehydrogenase maturation protein FdhE